MTPPAATVAGRRSTGVRPAGRSSRVGGARPPRRVSGPARPPARPSAAAALGGRLAAAAAVALPQPVTRPSAPPRRRPAAVPRPARRPDLPLGARTLEWLRALPDHRLLDRLISGRVWIVLLGTLLVGIVTLQLALLRLNAGIGRAVEQSTTLQQSNAALQFELSQLSNTDQVVAEATQMGYVWPPQGSPRFVTASPADAATALSTMRVPNPAAAAATSAAASTTATGVSATGADTTSAAATGTSPAATTTTNGTTAAPSGTVTNAPATGTAVPATTAAPATGATTPSAAVAGGASAPVGGQG